MMNVLDYQKDEEEWVAQPKITSLSSSLVLHSPRSLLSSCQIIFPFLPLLPTPTNGICPSLPSPAKETHDVRTHPNSKKGYGAD
jgi:hypothetical protein